MMGKENFVIFKFKSDDFEKLQVCRSDPFDIQKKI
jgi:hypothetical protein